MIAAFAVYGQTKAGAYTKRESFASTDRKQIEVLRDELAADGRDLIVRDMSDANAERRQVIKARSKVQL